MFHRLYQWWKIHWNIYLALTNTIISILIIVFSLLFVILVKNIPELIYFLKLLYIILACFLIYAARDYAKAFLNASSLKIITSAEVLTIELSRFVSKWPFFESVFQDISYHNIIDISWFAGTRYTPGNIRFDYKAANSQEADTLGKERTKSYEYHQWLKQNPNMQMRSLIIDMFTTSQQIQHLKQIYHLVKEKQPDVKFNGKRET